MGITIFIFLTRGEAHWVSFWSRLYGNKCLKTATSDVLVQISHLRSSQDRKPYTYPESSICWKLVKAGIYCLICIILWVLSGVVLYIFSLSFVIFQSLILARANIVWFKLDIVEVITRVMDAFRIKLNLPWLSYLFLPFMEVITFLSKVLST
jgi:hypothetical protein